MADDELRLVPQVPESLREGAQLGRLIPFVGAGVSRLAGCPSWAELADWAFKGFVEHGRFSHAQLDQIRSLAPRVKLSLAVAMQEEFQIKIDFEKLLHPVDRRDHATGRRIYASLSKLGRTFVTTNYDKWLDDELPEPSPTVREEADATADAAPRRRDTFYEPVDLNAANLNRANTVLHLHGSLKKPDGMIITTRDYVRHYANDRRLQTENPVLTFLDDLFRTKTVLFIGYGLEELEILEYVILKARALSTPGVQPRHFILLGFFSHEKELMLNMRRYYRECGIELLSFLKDHKGFDQLMDVLDEFARAIPASNLSVLQELDEMGGLLDG